MAAGDPYFDSCDKQNLGLESILKLLTVFDCDNKPALRITDLCASGGGSVFPTPVSRIPSFVRSSAAGTVSGARSVTFYNSGNADVIVDGGVLYPGESLPFSAGMYDTLADIIYDATGGELVISKVV